MTTCIHNLLGIWLADPVRLRSMRDLVVSGRLALRTREGVKAEMPSGPAIVAERDDYGDPYVLYRRETGVAVVPIMGAMARGDSSVPGMTNTVRTRRALRAAAKDTAVVSAILHVDSPGGTHDGTEALANEIEAFRALKPIVAHIEGVGASAAAWAAAATGKVYASHDSIVGSIGSIARVEDSSKAAEAEGIVVHEITDAPLKGGGDGAPVTEEHLAEMQAIVFEASARFRSEFSRLMGGEPKPSELKALRGGAFTATEGKKLGLIHGVRPFDQTLSESIERAQRKQAKSRAMAARMRLRRLA